MNAIDHSVYFDGRLDRLSSVSSFVSRVCRRLALDEITSYHVELAVVEAVTNSIRHALEGREAHPMHVRVAVRDEELLVSVSDKGRQAKLNLPKAGEAVAAPDELEEGGRGLFLISSLMDHVEHQSSAKGNTLLMTKVLTD